MVFVCAHVCFCMLCTNLSDVCFENRNNTSHCVECIHQRLIHLQHVYAQCVCWGRIMREVTYMVECMNRHSIPVPKWRHHHSSWSLLQWAGKQSEILNTFQCAPNSCIFLPTMYSSALSHSSPSSPRAVGSNSLRLYFFSEGVSNDWDVFLQWYGCINEPYLLEYLIVQILIHKSVNCRKSSIWMWSLSTNE